MIKKYFEYYIKKIKRYFSQNSKSRVLVAGLMVLAVFSLAFAIFYLTVRGLQSTQEGTDPFMIEAAPLYIYQLFFLITGFLIFVSSSIFGLLNFFKGEKDDWIMAGPQFSSLAGVKLIRAIIDSSWPVVVLAIPLLLAVHSVFSFGPLYFLFSLIVVISFSFFVAVSAILIIFLTSVILKKLKIKSFKALAGIIGAVCLSIGLTVWLRVVSVDINQLFQVEEAAASLSYLKSNFAIFPSHFPAMTIFYGQVANLSQGVITGLVTFGFFLLSVVLFELLRGGFLYIWQSFQEGSFEAKNKVEEKKSRFTIEPKSREDVIFKKELLVSLRSPKNIFWFSFLMILMIAQVGVVNLLERYVGIGMSRGAATSGITPALQAGVILFFVSALVLRFVFPALSQEGDTAWILGSSPLDFKKIFKMKGRFYSIALLLISLIALAVYVVPLQAAFEVVFILAMVIFLGVVSLTMLGLSMGAVFVNFKTDDPQTLSTSPSGIAFILISLTYSLIGGYGVYRSLSAGTFDLITVFILISIAIYFTGNYLGQKSLEKIEFL